MIEGAAQSGMREFHYRVRWRSRQALPGHHQSSRRGAGHEYAASAPLLDYPDPRRLDIRRSVRDPFGQLFVRVYNQHSLLPVYALMDLSGSMGFEGAASKLALQLEFISILAFSAGRTSDPFGVVACADEVLQAFSLLATRNGEAVREVLRRLSAFTPAARGAQGLLGGAQMIGHRRSLVFVISDFHFPQEFTQRLLRAYARHDVVPIVVWDSAEFRDPPAYGIARVRDSETRAERYVWLRPRFRQRLRDVFERRRDSLRRIFVSAGHKPYFLCDRIDCDDLNRFFIDR